MTSVLSPQAASFHPHADDPYGTPDFELAIFSDGVPTLTAFGYDSEANVLHGISDDALDQQFPPSAQEVYEMEATEHFVNTMASLAMLEEMEEHARKNFSHLQRRWETRRKMASKPWPPRHLVTPVVHNNKKRAQEQEDNKIVVFQHHHHDLALASMVNRSRAKAEARRVPSKINNKKMAMVHGHKMIQQPRKFA